MQATPLDIAQVPLSGVTLIEASAGTGKTYTLAALFVRLLLETELSVDQILVVTYTRAATAELRVRIRKRIGLTLEALDGADIGDDPVLTALVEDARELGQTAHKRGLLVSALGAFDEAAIFTIHGFCQRVLRRYAFESGVAFEVELSEDQALLAEEIACDFWAQRMALASEKFAAALDHQGIDIATLLRLMRRVLPNPELAVVPEAHAFATDGLEQAFRSALDDTLQLWAAHKPLIIELLLNSGLYRTTYSDKQVLSQYVPGLDQLAQSQFGQLPKWFERLTPEFMRTHCKKDGRPPEHAFFDACARLHEAATELRAAAEQQVYAFLHEFLAYARAELPRRSEERGLMGFEDLLLRLSSALQGEHGRGLAQLVRDTYRAALIDEFQDTDPVQLDVFQRIYAERSGAAATRPALFLIGDPKQAIYAFRGADIFAYLAASRSAIDRVHTLATNFRSDPSVIRGVEQLFTRAQLPFLFAEIQYRSVGARPGVSDALPGAALDFLLLERTDDQQKRRTTRGEVDCELPARIAAEIVRLLNGPERLDGQPIEPGQIAVLCRTNAQANMVQAALRERGVPAVLDGDASVFDAPMAEELGRWLWALADPADPARIRAALATQGLGFSAEDLLQLERDEAAWDTWVGRCHRLQTLWQTRGFLCALHALCEECQVTQRLLMLADGERRYTDLWHLAELLHDAEQRTRKGPHALLDFYRRVRAGVATRDGMPLEAVQLRLESDARAVTLTTVHKSKGLEYPIVYCPFLWASSQLSKYDKRMPLFHDRSADDRAFLVLPAGTADDYTADALASAQREALAEGLRLLYVALTRAKHRVSVVWGGGLPGLEHSALAYLLHQAQGSGLDADALRAATAERVKKLPDAQLLAELQQLVAAAAGAVGVRSLCTDDDPARYRAAPISGAALRARRATWPTYPQLRVGSFSSLIESHKTARMPAQAQVNGSDVLDRDALADRTAPASALADAVPEARIALADFPAGASVGHLVHAVYEVADFQASQTDLEQHVREVLADYAADAQWAPQLTAAIFDSLHTPLAAAGGALPSLSSIAGKQRLNELEFTFPVVDPSLSRDPDAALRSAELAAVLRQHARNPSEQAYADQLAKLRFAPLRGFLRGFIDLIAEHEGRYYVLDYKSNRLGDVASDYRRAQLELVMQRHHYTLQYLLYTVALHRYLALRLSGYDYEQHMGGVYYLFIRGMSTKNEPGTGVLFERPTRALIEDLSRWLQQPEAQA